MNWLAKLLEQLDKLWVQAQAIWFAGGWAMIAIAVVGVLLFGLGTHIWLRLRQTGFQSVPERRWRRWLDHPQERKGAVGQLIDFVSGGETVEQTEVFFRELQVAELAPFERDLRIMKICVGVAPLLGLLGTVTGMLATFQALAGGSGGDQTMGQVSKGISEALITTETGLVVALPGLLMSHLLTRKYERYRAFLAHLETVVTQRMYRRKHAAARSEPTPPSAASAAGMTT